MSNQPDESAQEVIRQEIQLDPALVNRLMRSFTIYYTLVLGLSIRMVVDNHQSTNCSSLLGSWILTMNVVYLLNNISEWVRYRHRHREPTRCWKRWHVGINLVYFSVAFLGHLLLIKRYSCHTSDSSLYYYAIFIIAHNYLILFALILLGLLYYLCLPCCLALIRPFVKRRGLDRTQMKRLNTIKYHQVAGTDMSCPICLENFSSDDDIVKLPCEHIYHATCVREWLGINATCPMCRGEVVVDGSLDEV